MNLVPSDPQEFAFEPEFEVEFVPEKRGRQTLTEDELLDEKHNEIRHRDETNPMAPPGHKVVHFLVRHQHDWVYLRRILWGLADEMPSMRFQVLNRRTRNPTILIMGLPEEVDKAVALVQADHDERVAHRADAVARLERSKAERAEAIEAAKSAPKVDDGTDGVVRLGLGGGGGRGLDRQRDIAADKDGMPATGVGSKAWWKKRDAGR